MTRRLVALAAAAAAVAAAACARGRPAEGAAPSRVATGTFRDAAGERIGVATLADTAGMLRLDLSVSRLSPGRHGLHVHAAGVCAPPDFKSAAAHFNPDGRRHGRLNPAGPHLGDLPNLQADADGSADTSFILSGDLLGTGPRSLFQPSGAALVIHADPDDERTDPAGDSGDRVACAVIERS